MGRASSPQIYGEGKDRDPVLRPNKRMKERDCTEIEVRRMMEHATNYYRSKEEGRWVIETRFRRKPWEVVVEPNAEKERLDVVTVYEVWDVK